MPSDTYDPLAPRSAAEYMPSIRDLEEEILHRARSGRIYPDLSHDRGSYLGGGTRGPYTDYMWDRYPADPDRAGAAIADNIRIQMLFRAIEELRREKDVERRMRTGGYGGSIEPQAAYDLLAGRSLSDWVKANPGYYTDEWNVTPRRTLEPSRGDY